MADSIPYRKGQGFAELSKYWPAANDNAAKKEVA
jgi:hypothetical protein